MLYKHEKVGIIIVNYNGLKDTIECINSIKKIKYKNYEIIVVDNNSTDNSQYYLKKIFSDDITLILNNENLGFSGANNVGIKYALDMNCEYILLLNNDTEVEEYFLNRMIECSINNNNSIVSPKIYYYKEYNTIWSAGGDIDWKKGVTYHYGVDKIDKGQYDVERQINFATGCCMLINKDTINKVGYLSEEYFLYYEDTDYCIKARSKGINIMYTPKANIWHKVSSSTGGAYSPLTLYYSTRNRLYFNDKYNQKNIISKLYFFATRIIRIIKWLIKREYSNVYATILGLKDYNKNIMGKREI